MDSAIVGSLRSQSPLLPGQLNTTPQYPLRNTPWMITDSFQQSLQTSSDRGVGGSLAQQVPADPTLVGTPAGQLMAQAVIERHRKGQASKRLRDLTAEKYLLHIDGENDSQWAEIIDGQAVIVPPRAGGSLRFQRNLLRPMVDNFVAYLTANLFRVIADAPRGRRSRDKARVDTLLANHMIQDQGLNTLLAEAEYLAAAYGYCPVHGTWRDDLTKDPYLNPFTDMDGSSQGKVPGYVDFWVGDPWDTCFDAGATRSSVHRVTYGRVLPVDVLHQAFSHVPGILDIRGKDDLPSVSRFQRIARDWEYLNSYHRGGAALHMGEGGDPQVALVCEETSPGIDPQWPEGRLLVVALDGTSSTDWTSSRGAGGTARLLHVGPLPGGRFSMVRFYSWHRFDDVHGKPYVADLSDLQVQLNQVATMRAERLKRYSMPQLMAKAGSIDEDTEIADPDSIMWVQSGDWPQFLPLPAESGTSDFNHIAADVEAQMFRIGGWQAASRGESHAGDPAAKVVALAKADDTVFGPISRHFAASVVELLQLGHALHVQYAELPSLAKVSGEDMGYAVEPWIRSRDLSETPPNYKMTSAFGATPEALMQTLQSMVVMQGADGNPLLTTDEFWDRVPDPTLKPHRPNVRAVKRQRLNAVNYYIEQLCQEAEGEYRDAVNAEPQLLMTLAGMIAEEVNATFPPTRTDEPNMAIEALDELVHDTTSSPLCRLVSEMRQSQYFDWLAQMASNAGSPGMQPGSMGGGGGPGGSGTPPASDKHGGTPGSDAMSPGRLDQEVRRLTSAANAGDIR